MMLHKIYTSVDLNYRVKHMDIQLNKQTNPNLVKVPKVLKPTKKKTVYRTLGISAIYSPLSPPCQTLALIYHIIIALC